MKYNTEIIIGKREISLTQPTYFIADIASNHNGDLNKAKELIWLAKEAQADAVKFQHFLAKDIVSDKGFKNLGQGSHQKGWKKSVYDTFEQYELKRDWNLQLLKEAQLADIEFFTTPYDYEAVNQIDSLVNAYKIGSGDISWIEFIEYISRKGKPVLLATGAASMKDVERAVAAVTNHEKNIVLMQCNTNYTGDIENFKYINLNVLKLYADKYPNMVLGLSDHTKGHSTVLGAVTLGARVIEKHFTNNNNQDGPDHKFSMNPSSWTEMVNATRELEAALGNSVKKVEENEQETFNIQRRGIYLKVDKVSGEIIKKEDINYLRPYYSTGYHPYENHLVIGKKVVKNLKQGDVLLEGDIEC